MKVLNLYSGIGGNRKLWENVEVTAVEIKEEIARIYRENFPEDHVVIGDAHRFLLEHFKEYDFIWSSPPCQTHSRTNYFLKGRDIIRYPDMRLYQEVLLLRELFKGKWVVENVIPYYEPLIRPQVIGRHSFWANFNISKIKQPKDDVGGMNGPYQKAHGLKQTERNAVNSELGLHILECALRRKQKEVRDYDQAKTQA